MKQKVFCFLAVLCICVKLMAQPSATPAPGYIWVKTGTSNYISGATSTVPDISTGNTAYGTANDSDPSSCSQFCSGNCDGATTFGVSLFGAAGYPTGTVSNCEQRAVTLTQWTNAKPDAAVLNGATAGIVFLPTSADVTILRSASPGTVGTGAGSNINRGKLFGGFGGANTTRVNVTNNYNISWASTAFSGAVSGTEGWPQTGSFTANDPGGSNFSIYTDWYTGNYGNTITANNVTAIPVNNISQTGGNFEVVFGATSTLSASRQFGNADAFVETNAGMEGRASFAVLYDVWEILKILPLTLTDFSVKKTTAGALLRWKNNTPQNNAYYTIQKSYDGANWQNTGVVTASNNSNTVFSFEDTHLQGVKNNVYYRLQLTEYGGAKIYSNVLVLKIDDDSDLALLPIGKNTYKLVTASMHTNAKVSVYNFDGRLALQQNTTSYNSTINLNNLAAGIYIINISTQGISVNTRVRVLP